MGISALFLLSRQQSPGRPLSLTIDRPLLDVLEPLHEQVKVNGIGRVEIIVVPERCGRLGWGQWLVERILQVVKLVFISATEHVGNTMERMTTHGRSRPEITSTARDVLPDPELPAMPMMLTSCHGGEYSDSRLLSLI